MKSKKCKEGIDEEKQRCSNGKEDLETKIDDGKEQEKTKPKKYQSKLFLMAIIFAAGGLLLCFYSIYWGIVGFIIAFLVSLTSIILGIITRKGANKAAADGMLGTIAPRILGNISIPLGAFGIFISAMFIIVKIWPMNN